MSENPEKIKLFLSFLAGQAAQIRAGGAGLFWQKLRKFGYLSLMNIAAPLAVYFRADWPQAYNYVGRKQLKRLKRMHSQTAPETAGVKTVKERAVLCFKTVVDQGVEAASVQDWLEAGEHLIELYYDQGKMADMDEICRRSAEVLDRLKTSKQFEDLGIEFIPRHVAIGSIGNYELLEATIMASLLGFRPDKKRILLVDPTESACNPCYLDYWKRYITVITDPLLVKTLEPLEKQFTAPLNLYMPLNGKMNKTFLTLGQMRERWIDAGRPPLLSLLNDDEVRGWQALEPFGMSRRDWFVCLHVREGGWRDGHAATEDHRNADVDSYIPVIKAITDAGGWVIRMGDPGMKPFAPMPRVIDYAHSDAKTDWMDVFLCARCRFFVGTSSGLYTLAMAFGNPVVMTNLLPASAMYFFTSRDVLIPRLCKKRREDRYMTFREILSPPFGVSPAEPDHVEICANTDHEIKDLVGEMLARCDGRSVYTDEDNSLQEAFRAMTRDCGRLYGSENPVLNARIGKAFLKTHADLLSGDMSNAIKEEKVTHAS